VRADAVRLDHRRLQEGGALTKIDQAFIRLRLRQIAAFERSYGKPRQRLFQNGAKPMLNVAETIDTRPQVRRTAPTAPLAPAQSAPSSLLDVILRAGTDPNFDVEKFSRLVAIQREEQDRQDAREDKQAELAAQAAFHAAMSAVQKQMGRIATDAANTSTRSRYASYGALDRAVRPLYTEANFDITFNEDIEASAPDMVRVLAYVTHTAPGATRSHTRTYHTDIPADGKGAKGGDVMTKTHAHVSATSYGKRVLLGMIFNIATGNDDDGNAASARTTSEPDRRTGTISRAQADEIRTLLDNRNISHRAFLQRIRLARIEDIGTEHFERAVALIKTVGGK